MDNQERTGLELSDEDLAAQVCQRDVTAFELLYERYARPVYVLAAHLLGSAHADEIVQDVFLRFWNKADQFQAERGSLRAWLMSIARHRIFDELRRLNHRRSLEAVEEIDRLLAGASDPRADVEDEARLHELGDVVLGALRGLPAEQRRVLVLAYFGGLSQSDIARRLGWPLGTVKKRTRLGMQKLHASLAGRGSFDQVGLVASTPEKKSTDVEASNE